MPVATPTTDVFRLVEVPRPPWHAPMPLPRTGQLDDRRRRVLTEEVIGAGASADPPNGDSASRTSSSRRRSSSSERPYGDDTLTDRQPRVTDLIPRRYSIVALFWLAGLTAIAGLEALYVWMPDWAALTRDGQLPAADLQSEGSLASWFSSTVLLLAALVSAVVYSVRRHRKDDYHGRYRVWLWSALVWLAMSVDEGSSLHEAFRELIVYATGRRGWGDGSIWWIAAYGVVLAVVGARLLLEMRVCRLSTTVLLVAAGCYAAAVASRLEGLLPADGMQAVMVKEGCEMAGNLWLLLAMVLHARNVILEAEGRLPAKRVKAARPEKKADKPRPESAAGGGAGKRSWFRRVKVDAAHAAVPAPAQAREASKAATVTARPEVRGRSAEEYDYEVDDQRHVGRHSRPSTADDEDGDGDDYASDRPLSKAQRKALRRQKERQRRGAE